MIREDDRTREQEQTHYWLICGTDRFLSSWGKAENGTSVAAWACRPDDANRVLNWVKSRSDMQRVRETIDRPGERYRPKCAHLHIYLVDDKHPALQ